MPAVEQLGDRPAHRVAGNQHRSHCHFLQEGGEIVGAIGEPERVTRPDPTRVAAKVRGKHAELLPERLERTEPVQPPARHPTVDQEQGRRTGWPAHLADERRASPGERDTPPERNGRTQCAVRPGRRRGNAVTNKQLQHVERMHLRSPRCTLTGHLRAVGRVGAPNPDHESDAGSANPSGDRNPEVGSSCRCQLEVTHWGRRDLQGSGAMMGKRARTGATMSCRVLPIAAMSLAS